MRRSWRRITLLAVAALVTTSASASAQSHVAGVDAPATPFRLTTLDGKPIALSDFHGKPLVINFFASWCDPCRDEMPLINALAARGRANGYAVLGIAVEDRQAAVQQFASAAKLDFPVALDANSRVKRAFRIFGPPATFFIDGSGTIRDIVMGPLSAERAGAALKNAGVVR